MIMPGVQNPHCRPCFSQNAFWSGCRPSSGAMPSIVVIVRAVRLDREHRAGLHGLAVDVDGAGAALARVAADVGTGQVEILAERLDEEASRLDVELPSRPVDRQLDVFAHGQNLLRCLVRGHAGGRA